MTGAVCKWQAGLFHRRQFDMSHYEKTQVCILKCSSFCVLISFMLARCCVLLGHWDRTESLIMVLVTSVPYLLWQVKMSIRVELVRLTKLIFFWRHNGDKCPVKQVLKNKMACLIFRVWSIRHNTYIMKYNLKHIECALKLNSIAGQKSIFSKSTFLTSNPNAFHFICLEKTLRPAASKCFLASVRLYGSIGL